MTKGLRKDLRRSIGKSFSRFLSILLISALGVAFFAGVRTAAPAMEASADATYDDQNLMDIRVLGTLGMTTEDVAAFLGLAGVEDAEGLYTADYLCETDIATVVVKVSSMTNRINQVRVTEGRFPERYDECIVDRAFLDASGYALGDTVRLRTGTEESVSDKLAADEFTIVGIGETAYYMDADRGTASIGDGTGDGMMIVPKEAFTTDIFSEVLVTMTGADELNCFSADYEALLETVTQNIESLEQGRCEVRLEQFKADADDQLNDARYEYQKQKDKAMRDLSDAYQTLTAWGLLEDGLLDLTTEAPGPEYPGRPYEDLTGADWVLVSDTVPLDTARLEPTDIPCPAGYTLWHNPDPVRLWFTR